MAVEARKSSLITNADAVPAVLNNPRIDGGFERVKVSTADVTNLDSIGSTYRLFRVPSNAVMTDLRVYCPAITTAATDIGLYRTAKDGGAVVDADLFTSAQVLTSALAGTDVLHESGVFSLANSGKELWDALGLTSDPSVFYDVTMTLTAAAGSTGVVKVIGRYSA
jgi:hypothetical protein